MNYYQFHIGDYAVHTRHLSLLEDLAYRRLLDLYYTSEGDIPAVTQSVSRILGMREHVAEVESVMTEFFTVDESGKLCHARCDAEIAKTNAAAARARANGKTGGRPVNANPDSSPKHNNNPAVTQPVKSYNPDETKSQAPNTQYPIPNTKEKEKPPLAFAPPEWIPVETWNAYLEVRKAKRAGKAVSALTLIVKDLAAFRAEGHDPVRILEASIKSSWVGVFAPKPERQSATGETAYQRTMRERMEKHSPEIAAKNPAAAPFVHPMDFLENEVRNVIAIPHR